MKKLVYTLIPVLLLILPGCNDGSESGLTNPFFPGLGDGGGGVNLNITVNLVYEQGTNNYYFQFTPTTAVWITNIRAICNAVQIDQTINVNNMVNTNDPLLVGVDVEILQNGQQWQFIIQGNIGNAQGQSFNATLNYTI